MRRGRSKAWGLVLVAGLGSASCFSVDATSEGDPFGGDGGAGATFGPSAAAGGTGSPQDDEPTAYASFDVPPDGDCVVSADADLFISQGTYDISVGLAPGNANNCANSYFVNLKVEGAPATTRFHEAEVSVQTIDDEILDFGGMLPNPYSTVVGATVESTGLAGAPAAIVAFEAIPEPYAGFLGELVGATIILEMGLVGTTADGVEVTLRRFQFPVRICDGCLTMCLYNDVLNNMLTIDDVRGGDCDDVSLSGQDGRVCIDPDC